MWDYLVVLAWLAVVFLVVGIPTLRGWEAAAIWSRPGTADAAVTVLTVVPYLGYLVLTERGTGHATWGKRRAGLVVAGADGASPETAGIVLRNLIKVLPWQLGHMAALRFAMATGPLWVAGLLNLASLTLLLLVAAPPLAGRRGVHDRAAGTTVVRRQEVT